MSQSANDSYTSRHARHAASGAGGVRVPKGTGRPTGGTHFAGSTTNHYKNYSVGRDYDSDGMAEQAAPRPVLDPAATGSFQRIDASMGAKVENRTNVEQLSADSTSSWRRSGYGNEMRISDAYRPQTRSHETKTHTSRKFVAIVTVLIVVVIACGAYLAHVLLTAEPTTTTKTTQAEKVVADVDETISYRGTAYSLSKQADGSYAIVSTQKKGAGLTVLSSLNGTPKKFVLYKGTILVPEDLEGGWDVLAYTIGTGQPASQVVGSDGKAVTGTGTIKSVKLSGTNLVIADSKGKTTKVAVAGSATSISQGSSASDGSSSGSGSTSSSGTSTSE
ncbi:MAG: hypothetical protein ACI38Z_07015 [Parafannyhessea sp.]|uniref:hypothetical protein n=1 Tax=Parafannyhessea sp. TaxID=2847324 RepID=UPI003F0CE207